MTEHEWLAVLLVGGFVSVFYAACHDYGPPDGRALAAAISVFGAIVLVVGFVGVALT